MAKYTATISAQNTSVYVCDVHKPRSSNQWVGTAIATGTFGTGTVTWQGSVDGGSTKFDLRDISTGTAAALTANGMNNLRLGGPDTQFDTLKIYATIATATNPSIAITVYDNR